MPRPLVPSSLIPAARRQPLADLLSQVPDQRKERGRRHPLAGLPAVGTAAVTAGARSFAAIGQVAVDAKSNEIPAVRELLKAFADLTGAVVTMDALHARHDTARAVPDRRADYVMTVKANMPTLYAQLKKLPWKDVPGFSHAAVCRPSWACQ